jgi:hypothetical protein
VLESNYQLPRHWVFFLPAFLIWSVWLGLGFDAAIGQTRPLPSRHRALAVAAIVVAVIAVQAGSAWARGAITLVRSEAGSETLDAWRQDLQRSPIAERFGRLAFANALPEAIVVCDWEQATVLWYLQRVEGARPDLLIRYPIERLDETLAEARRTGRAVYLSRTLPGVEARGVLSSHGPLLQVLPPPGPVPPTVQRVEARFEGGLALVGVDWHAPTLRPGSVVPFTLYWRADSAMTHAYAVSVRLVSMDGTILAAHDERHPGLGTSPTNRWAPGQVVGDYRELPIGSRLQPGAYRVQVVPYRVDPLRNLRRLDQSGQQSEDGVSLPIEVEPRAIAGPLDLLAFVLAR